jgi:hypothetical protein
VLVTTIAADGTVQLGEDARRLGFEPGKVVQVIRTSGGSLILALHDEPVLIEATSKRLPAATTQPALSRSGRG